MRRGRVAIAPALLIGAVAVLSAAPAHARTSVPTISVLSNRADLVSDGDALVRVTVPRGVRASQLRLTAGSRDVTRVLRRTGTRQLTGLVEGLRVGRVALVARLRGTLASARRRAARRPRPGALVPPPAPAPRGGGAPPPSGDAGAPAAPRAGAPPPPPSAPSCA